MAESVVFDLASKILSTIASPVLEKAYEKGILIREARDELAKLQVTIETIQAVLLDAEKKQQGSAAVKNWIKRLKGVLYHADDLFDEVATEDLLKQQIMKGKDNVFSKKFGFDRCQIERPVSDMRRGQDPGCFVDAKAVIGRDEDKKVILEMLFNELNSVESDLPIVIAIVGIGALEFKSFPLCPQLRGLRLYDIPLSVIQQQRPSTVFCPFTSPHLEVITIRNCNQITSFELVEAPHLGLIKIEIFHCKQLKILHIASPLNALEELTILYCPEMDSTALELKSFPNLRLLYVDRLPPPKKLPHCLRHRQALGLLQIIQVTREENCEREHSSEEED